MTQPNPDKEQLLSGNLSDNEYDSFYQTYTRLCRGENLFICLESGSKMFLSIMADLTDEKASYRYEKGKWSLKQVIGHITDTERIMAFRALSFARGEKAEIPGYDHNSYVDEANFDERPLNLLVTDYANVRRSTVDLFDSFSAEMLMRTGTANEKLFSVRALGYIIAGHERHHLTIIEDKYLPGLK